MNSGLKKDYSEIIRKCYLEILKREPDEIGLNHFLKLMQEKQLDEEKLTFVIKSSDEYKRIEAEKYHSDKKPYVYRGLYDIAYVIHPNSVLDDIVIKQGIFDKWVGTRLKKFIKPDGIIFDVGAHAGLLSLPFAKHYVLHGKVYSFEPNPEIINRLQENVKINHLENIIIEHLALQDDSAVDTVVLYKRRAVHDNGLINDGLSTLEPNSTYRIGSEKVRTTTIDKYVKNHNIINVDLIKIDTEGSDFRVLLGGNNTIDKSRPIVIYEFSSTIDMLIDFQYTQKCHEFLKNKGYKQYRIINEETLLEFDKYDGKIPDSNIVCFHESKLPS